MKAAPAPAKAPERVDGAVQAGRTKPVYAASAAHLPPTANTLTSATTGAPAPLTPADFLRAAAVEPEAESSAAKPAASKAPAAPPVETGTPGAASLPQSMPKAATDAVSAPAAAPHPLTQSHPRKFQMPETEPAKEIVVEQAMNAPVPTLYGRGGHLIVPPPMKGTREILAHQNAMADSEGLSRIQDDDDLNRMREQHLLVALTGSSALEVNPELPANRRYARPWTAHFVGDIARNFSARFHTPLRLNSAVRTVNYQLRLQRVNGNAAGIDGDTASPHLTGQAIDFGKRGMSVAQIAWMRAYLGPLMDAGKIDVEEEFQQACFHISVYRSYLPAARSKTAHTDVAQLHAPRPARSDEDSLR